MSRVTELLEEIIGRAGAVYYAASGATRPTGKDGDTLIDPATGNTFKWYGERWHLKTLGTYTDIKFTVTFNKGTASAVSEATREVTYDDAYGDLPTTTPAAGYELEGWYLDAEFTLPVEADDIVTIEADATLYANHTPVVYDISYNLDGGTNDGDNPDVYDIETPTIVLADATKEGYTFDGWYEEDTFTTAVTEIALGSTGDVMLYAKFTAIKYDITYNLDGGTNGANPATYDIEDTPVALADATKDGFTFLGWFSDAELTTEVTEIALGSTGDVVLYAGFTVIEG